MREYLYKVTLSDGEVNHNYVISANNEREAIILAKAKALNKNRGCNLVALKLLDTSDFRVVLSMKTF